MHVVQYNDGHDPVFGQCIAQVKSKMPAECTHTTLTSCDELCYNQDVRGKSNVARFRRAASDPDMLWLDADILCVKWPDFDALEPGFVYWAKGQGRNPNNWLFWVNGRNDLFQEMMIRYDEEKPTDFWWFHKEIQKFPFKFIPEGHFVHLYWNGTSKAKGFKSKGNKYYQISPMAGTEQLKLDILIK
jgi:hypothetical protein